MAGTVSSPISWHVGHFTTCNIFIPVMPMWGKEKPLSRQGTNTRSQWRRQKRNITLWLSSPRLYPAPSFVHHLSPPPPSTKKTMQLKGFCSAGFVRRSLSAMATRGNTQYTVLSVYSAHTDSGICYNLMEETCLFRALTDIPEAGTEKCLGAYQPGVQGVWSLSWVLPLFLSQQLMLSFRSSLL